jgi:hypothetical protein
MLAKRLENILRIWCSLTLLATACLFAGCKDQERQRDIGPDLLADLISHDLPMADAYVPQTISNLTLSPDGLLLKGEISAFTLLPEIQINKLSDDLRGLPEDRYTWALDLDRVHQGMGGSPTRPKETVTDAPEQLTNIVVDILSGEDNHHVPHRWQLPNGDTLLLNVGGNSQTVAGQEIPPRTAILVKRP